MSQAETNFEDFENGRVITIPQLEVLSSFEKARGYKRGYCQTIDQAHPPTVNSMGSSSWYQNIFQMDGCHQKSNTVGAVSKRQKKKKNEHGPKTNINGNLCGTEAIKGCSSQIPTKCVNDINGSGYQISDNELVKRLGDWHAQSIASGSNLPNQIHFKQHLSSKKLTETIVLTPVTDTASLTTTTSEKCNLLPPTPPGKAPTPGDRLARKTCHTNGSAKQNVKCNLGKSTSSGRDQMQSEHGEVLQDHLQYSAKIKGTVHDK